MHKNTKHHCKSLSCNGVFGARVDKKGVNIHKKILKYSRKKTRKLLGLRSWKFARKYQKCRKFSTFETQNFLFFSHISEIYQKFLFFLANLFFSNSEISLSFFSKISQINLTLFEFSLEKFWLLKLRNFLDFLKNIRLI